MSLAQRFVTWFSARQTARPSAEDTKEISSSGEDLYAKYRMAPYHPDTLVNRKGGLKIYDQMRTDEQIKASLNLKKLALLGPDWSIEPASDDPTDQEIADFVDYVLRRLDGTLKRRLRKILSALDYGFSVTEKVWEIIPDGPHRGKIGLRALKTRRPHTFSFATDDHGNLLPDGIRQQLPGSPMGYPISKFIVWSYGADFDDSNSWYGVSDLRAAYRSWWSKDIIIRFWNIYLERFGMPTVKAGYNGALSDKEERDLDDILNNIQSRTGIKFPDDKIKLDLLQATRQGEAGYEAAVKAHDIRIARALLIPEKLGFADSAGGSYNLGEVQFDLFLMAVSEVKAELEESVMGEQVIRQLVDFNFPGVERYPKFRIGALTQENRNELAKRWQTLTGIKVLRPETRKDLQYMRREQGLPELTEDEWEEWEEAAKEAARAREALARQLGRPARDPDGDLEGDPDGDPPGKSKFSLSREPTPYEAKLDLDGIARGLELIEAEGVTALAAVVAKQRDALLSQVAKLSKARRLDAKAVDKLQLRYVGEFRQAVAAVLEAGYQRGATDAAREIGGIVQYALEDALPVTPASYFAAKAFSIAGIARDDILRQAKLILLQHIKSGATLRETLHELQDMFRPWVEIGEAAPAVLAPARVENIIRTNLSEAYNEARKATFRDPEVADFVPAYQYSAILDQRTTPFCASWDGFVAAATDPIWDTITPPNHYQCRSLIVPIIQGEGYELTDPQPSELPQKGFYCAHEPVDHWADEFWGRVEARVKELIPHV